MCRIVVCNFGCGSGEYDVCRLEQLHLGIVGKDSLQKKVDFVIKGSLAEKLPIYERHPSKVK